MTARKLPHQQGTAEWFAARTGTIGGSEIGAVMGWSPYATRAQLLADKLDPPERTPDTDAQDRGKRLEPAILAWLLDKHGLILDATAAGSCWQHAALPWATFSPDGIADSSKGRVLLECKTTADRNTEKGWGRAGTANVPLGYLAQTTWGMGILGIPVCHVGVLAGGINGRPSLAFASYKIPFRPDLYSRLLQGAALFIAELNAARKAAA